MPTANSVCAIWTPIETSHCSLPALRRPGRKRHSPVGLDALQRADKKTPKTTYVRDEPPALHNSAIAHPSVRKLHVVLHRPLRRLLRRLTVARRALSFAATNRFNRSTYRCLVPITFVRASARQPSPRKSNDCGARPLESTRETRSGDDPAVRAQVSRKTTPPADTRKGPRCVRSSPQWASPSTGASACSSPRKARGGSLR